MLAWLDLAWKDIALLFIGAALPIFGYFAKRKVENHDLDENINRQLKTAELHEKLSSRGLTLSDLDKLQKDLVAGHSRFARLFDRAAKTIPNDRRIAPPTEILGPSIEHMRWLDQESPIWKMFEEVLLSAMDKERIKNVHPSFVIIIKQLSRDEALILYRLKTSNFDIVDTMDLNVEGNRFENRKVEQSGIPVDDLYVPEMFDVTYSHLQALGLVEWPIDRQDAIVAGGKQTGVRRFSRILLTKFGESFVTACVPVGGFPNL